MNFVSKKRGILKRFLDARWAWNLIQQLIYNRLILNTVSELDQQFLRENLTTR